MKNFYPFFYWAREAAQNPEETASILGILWLLIKWAIMVAISAAIVAFIVAGIAKFFGKDFEEWLKGTFTVWCILMVLSTIASCLSML